MTSNSRFGTFVIDVDYFYLQCMRLCLYLMIIFRSKNNCVQIYYHFFPSVLPMVCFKCNKISKEKKTCFSTLIIIKDVCAEKNYFVTIRFQYLYYQKCFIIIILLSYWNIWRNQDAFGQFGSGALQGHNERICNFLLSTFPLQCSQWPQLLHLHETEWESHWDVEDRLVLMMFSKLAWPTTVAPSPSTSWIAAFIVPPVSIHWSTRSSLIPAGKKQSSYIYPLHLLF